MAAALERQLRETFNEARNHFQRRRFVEADMLLLEVLNGHPSDGLLFDAGLLRAQTLRHLRDDRKAVEICEQLLQRFPNHHRIDKVYWLAGLIYTAQGNMYRATTRFQTIIDEFPNSEHIDGAYYHVAWDLLEIGNTREARALLTKVYSAYRDGEYWSHATWTLAQLAFENGDYARSENLVRELLNNPPDLAVLDRVLFLKGQLALERRNYGIAQLAFETLMTTSPRSQLYAGAERFVIDITRQAQASQDDSVRR